MSEIINLFIVVGTSDSSAEASNSDAIRVRVSVAIANVNLVHLGEILLELWSVLAVSSPFVVEHGVILSLRLASAVVKRRSEWGKPIVLEWAGRVTIGISESIASISLFTQASVFVEVLEGIALSSLLLTKAGIDIAVSLTG